MRLDFRSAWKTPVNTKVSKLPIRCPGATHRSIKDPPIGNPANTGRQSRLPVRIGYAHQSNKAPPTNNINNNGLNGKAKPVSDKTTKTKVTLNRQKVKKPTITPDKQDHRPAIERRIQQIEAQSKPKPQRGLFGSYLPPIGSTTDLKPIPGTEHLPNMGFVFGSHGPPVPPATPRPPSSHVDLIPRQNTAAIKKDQRKESAAPKPGLVPMPPTAKPDRKVKLPTTRADAASRQVTQKCPGVDMKKSAKPVLPRPPTSKAIESRVANKGTKAVGNEATAVKSAAHLRDTKCDRKPRPTSAKATPAPRPPTANVTPTAGTPAQTPPLVPRPPTAKASDKKRPHAMRAKLQQSGKAISPTSARKPNPPQPAHPSISSSTPGKSSPRPKSAGKSAKPLKHTPKRPEEERTDVTKARPFPGQIPVRPTATMPRLKSTKPAATPVRSPRNDTAIVVSATKIAEVAKPAKAFGPSDYEIRKAAKADSDDEGNYDYEDDFEDDDTDCESLESLTEVDNKNANHETFDIIREDASDLTEAPVNTIPARGALSRRSGVYIERVDKASLLAEYSQWKEMAEQLREALIDADIKLDDMLAWYAGIQTCLENLKAESDRADRMQLNAKTESERAKNKASELDNSNDDMEADNRDEQIDLIDTIRQVNTIIQMIRAFKAGRLDVRIERIKNGKCAKAMLQTLLMQADLDELKAEYRELKKTDDDEGDYKREIKKATNHDIDNCLGAFRKTKPVKITKDMTIEDIKSIAKKDPSELVDTEDIEDHCTLELFMREIRKKAQKTKTKNKTTDTRNGHKADTDYTVQNDIIELGPMESATVATYSDSYRMIHNRQIQQEPNKTSGLFPSIQTPDIRPPTIAATVEDDREACNSPPTVDLPSISRPSTGKLLKRHRKNV